MSFARDEDRPRRKWCARLKRRDCRGPAVQRRGSYRRYRDAARAFRHGRLLEVCEHTCHNTRSAFYIEPLANVISPPKLRRKKLVELLAVGDSGVQLLLRKLGERSRVRRIDKCTENTCPCFRWAHDL